MDLLLALTEDGLHEVLWTDALLDEWERVIVREHARTAASARAITDAIREYFFDSRIDRVRYEDLIASMPGPDPDDQEHAAAAVAAGVDAIVTWNAGDFPIEVLAAHGVRVVDPDTYLVELLEQVPIEVVATVERIAAEKRRPPMTTRQLLARLSRAGVPNFVVQIIPLLT